MRTSTQVSDENEDNDLNIKELGQGKTKPVEESDNLHVEDEVKKTELKQSKIKSLTKFFKNCQFVTVCKLLGNVLIHASYCFFGASKTVLVIGAFVALLGSGCILKLVCKIFCANVSTAQLVFGKVVLTLSQSGIFFLITGILLSSVHTIPLKLLSEALVVVSVTCVFFAYLHMPMGTIRLEDITPGTILIHPRPPVISSFCVLYSHFEVVVDVDYENEIITVIGLQTPPDKQFWLKLWDISSSGKAEIIKIKKKLKDVKHCYYKKPTDSKRTIERAQDAYEKQTINEKKIKYSLSRFNCEHFCSYCENGTAVSNQVDEILEVTRSPIIGCYDVLVLFVYLCLYQFR